MQDTIVQVALVGLSMNRDGNCNLEMTHINLEHFRIPSDDVMMTTTTCTPEGRIFLGGNDGHLYEVEYRNRNSWLKGRCNKVRHTLNDQLVCLHALLPSPSLQFIILFQTHC